MITSSETIETADKTNALELRQFLIAERSRVDAELDRFLPPESTPPFRLHAAIRWSVFAGGKRFRPLLALAVGQTFGVAVEQLLSIACALEMIHTYLLMLATLPFHDRIGFDYGLVVGYTTIVLSFMLVFFGIRSYRDNVSGGRITFGKAFAVGILITLITCIFYVGTWEVIYFKFMPDFAENFTKYAVEKVVASGTSTEVINAKIQEMKDLTKMLNNPLMNAAITFTEPFPVGLIITLISAAILRTKRKPAEGEENIGAPLTSS